MCYRLNNNSLNAVKDTLGQHIGAGDLIMVTTTGYSHSVNVRLAIVTDPQRAMVRQLVKKRINGLDNWVPDSPRKLQAGFRRSVKVSLGQVQDNDLRTAAMQLIYPNDRREKLGAMRDLSA